VNGKLRIKEKEKMMDYTDSNNLSTMTDEEIKRALEALANEVNYRKRQKEANLIEDFRRAWFALNSIGVNVSYDNDGEEICLNHWDDFDFS
jgi:hypothetical protein